MKKLLTLASLLLLSGCVTYYYPETALEDGVYYAEDDPSYVIDSSGYAGVSYYPWSSIDSFYLGYYPYRGYGYGYSGGFSLGISYGYSPWRYGYYSPWYAWHAPYYHYSHYYAWRPHYGHHYNRYGHGNRHYGNKHYNRKGKNRNDRNDSDYRYAGNQSGNNNRGNRRGEYADDVKRPTDLNNRNRNSNGRQSGSVKRYVSTTPSGHPGNRGMEVRSRGSKNTGKTRTQPIDDHSITGAKRQSSGTSVAPTKYRSTRTVGSASEVRYRAGPKGNRSRVQPVKTAPKSIRYANTKAPVNNSGHANKRGPSGQATARTSSRSASQPRVASRSSRKSGPSQSSHASSGSRQSRQSDSSNHKNRK